MAHGLLKELATGLGGGMLSERSGVNIQGLNTYRPSNHPLIRPKYFIGAVYSHLRIVGTKPYNVSGRQSRTPNGKV